MAEDAEKKNIARLDFKIDDAINSLEKIDQKLETIAKSSEAYAKKIGDNLGKAVNSGNLVNTTSVGKDLDKVTNLSKNKADQLSVQLQKIEAKKQAQMTLQAQKGEQDRQTAAYKSALKQEEYNNRVLKSTKTLYDKISEYAKTYIIYQGFNELRQGVKETIDEMVEMEYQMVQIDRVLNDSSLNIDIYRDKLIQMAQDYANSFENVADITLRLAQAGYDADESLALTEKTLLALNTAELDATQATDDMVAVMAQWGLMTGTASEQAETYGNIIDKINKVADNFPTTSADILDALKKTSSAFNLAGASIDETIATIVAAEKASQRGGKVIGTALSNIIQQLKAEKKLDLAEELGLNFFKDAKKTEFRPVMEIFQEMSEMMQNLKDQGKESSVEMQGLLEMFTVFRRNIGASLLSEMAGEDSTYAEVLKTSLNSVGYSLEENTKHMKTAKAAQAQFNTEVLKLKTQVWEAGLEEVFRDMLNMGTDLIQNISKIIDKFGLLPTSIGVVTAAITSLKSKVNIGDFTKLTNQIKGVNDYIHKTGTSLKSTDTVLEGANKNFVQYATSLKKGNASMSGYVSSLIAGKVATVGMTVATIALNAAISAGLSIAITLLVKKISDVVNEQKNYIEQQQNMREASIENATTIREEIDQLDELKDRYKELASKENRTSEENEEIYQLQAQINELIKESGQQVKFVTEKVDEQGKKVLEINEAYDEQIQKIQSIRNEMSVKEVNELEQAVEASKKSVAELKKEIDELTKGNAMNLGRYSIEDSFKMFEKSSFITNISEGITDANIKISEFSDNWNLLTEDVKNSTLSIQLNTIFGMSDTKGTVETLKKLREELQKVENPSNKVSKAIEVISETIDEYEEEVKKTEQTMEEYNVALSEFYSNMGFAADYSSLLREVWGTYSDSEAPRQLIENIEDINTSFSNGEITIKEYFDKIQQGISEIDLSEEAEDLEAYQAIFAMTAESMANAIETIRAGYESETIDFTEYSQQIGEAAENMLELYTNEQKLIENEQGMWTNEAGQVNEFASSLQEGITTIQDMSEVLNVLHENMGILGEAAASVFDDGKIAAEEFATLTTSQYNNLVSNMTIALNNLSATNSEAFKQIVSDTTANLHIQESEMINSEGRLQQGFLNNYSNMAATLSAVTETTESAVTTASQALGEVLKALADTIENFSYEITGSINKVSLTDFFIGDMKTPIKVPEFTLSITGKDTSKGGISQALRTLSSFVSNSDNDFTYKPPKFTLTTPVTTTKPTSPSSPSSPRGTGGGSSSSDKSDYYAEREAERAKKAEEDAYKERLAAFEDYIDNKEEDEENWVKRQKELNQLSNEDFLYITQQRIERYKKYLEEVEKATWIKEEDKMKLRREYSEKIKDLEVDYLGYLEDQLNAEIEAIEDANDEKIKLIEEEADAKIAALKKVEDERDRERETEDYQKERQSILDEISYWEQRTGREAQEALVEARKKLAELDAEWEDTQEDWSIEDQIKKIEEERDAEIKALEDARDAEIKAMQDVYDAKVKMFAETGEIIYEGSVIQAQSLYNAYKANFIDPISSELANLNKAETTTTAPAPQQQQQYETYLIKAGDTLSKIARKYGTTVEKLMAANPYITNKNKIFAGKTLQIPKFHEGGIVGGNQEAFALLKPDEVILKTEWAASLNRMMKYFDNVTTGKTNGFTNNPVIEVKGNLIQIDADIKSKSDVDYLERRIEKMLKSKFNIKK